MHDWHKSIVLTWSVVCTYAGRWVIPTIYLMTVNISLEEIMHRCTDIFSQCMVWWFSHISMLHYGWLSLVTVVVVLLQFLSSLQAWDITILSSVKDTFPQVNNLVSPCILFLELWPIIHKGDQMDDRTVDHIQQIEHVWENHHPSHCLLGRDRNHMHGRGQELLVKKALHIQMAPAEELFNWLEVPGLHRPYVEGGNTLISKDMTCILVACSLFTFLSLESSFHSFDACMVDSACYCTLVDSGQDFPWCIHGICRQKLSCVTIVQFLWGS